MITRTTHVAWCCRQPSRSPLELLFLGLFVAALGTPLAWGVAAGFYLGYVIYDTLHFALHHRRWKGRLGRRLRELGR